MTKISEEACPPHQTASLGSSMVPRSPRQGPITGTFLLHQFIRIALAGKWLNGSSVLCLVIFMCVYLITLKMCLGY